MCSRSRVIGPPHLVVGSPLRPARETSPSSPHPLLDSPDSPSPLALSPSSTCDPPTTSIDLRHVEPGHPPRRSRHPRLVRPPAPRAPRHVHPARRRVFLARRHRHRARRALRLRPRGARRLAVRLELLRQAARQEPDAGGKAQPLLRGSSSYLRHDALKAPPGPHDDAQALGRAPAGAAPSRAQQAPRLARHRRRHRLECRGDGQVLSDQLIRRRLRPRPLRAAPRRRAQALCGPRLDQRALFAPGRDAVRPADMDRRGPRRRDGRPRLRVDVVQPLHDARLPHAARPGRPLPQPVGPARRRRLLRLGPRAYLGCRRHRRCRLAAVLVLDPHVLAQLVFVRPCRPSSFSASLPRAPLCDDQELQRPQRLHPLRHEHPLLRLAAHVATHRHVEGQPGVRGRRRQLDLGFALSPPHADPPPPAQQRRPRPRSRRECRPLPIALDQLCEQAQAVPVVVEPAERQLPHRHLARAPALVVPLWATSPPRPLRRRRRAPRVSVLDLLVRVGGPSGRRRAHQAHQGGRGPVHHVGRRKCDALRHRRRTSPHPQLRPQPVSGTPPRAQARRHHGARLRGLLDDVGRGSTPKVPRAPRHEALALPHLARLPVLAPERHRLRQELLLPRLLGSRPAPRQLGPLARRRARLDGQNVRRDRPRRAAPTVERQDPPGPALVDPHQALLLEPGLPLERARRAHEPGADLPRRDDRRSVRRRHVRPRRAQHVGRDRQLLLPAEPAGKVHQELLPRLPHPQRLRQAQEGQCGGARLHEDPHRLDRQRHAASRQQLAHRRHHHGPAGLVPEHGRRSSSSPALGQALRAHGDDPHSSHGAQARRARLLPLGRAGAVVPRAVPPRGLPGRVHPQARDRRQGADRPSKYVCVVLQVHEGVTIDAQGAGRPPLVSLARSRRSSCLSTSSPSSLLFFDVV